MGYQGPNSYEWVDTDIPDKLPDDYGPSPRSVDITLPDHVRPDGGKFPDVQDFLHAGRRLAENLGDAERWRVELAAEAKRQGESGKKALDLGARGIHAVSDAMDFGGRHMLIP